MQYCFATRDDALLRWVLVALGALAQDEVMRYRLVNDGALAAAAAAEASAASDETKVAVKRLTALLPLPIPVLGSVILKEVGEDVCVQCSDDSWVQAASSRIYNHPGTVTSLSANFVQRCSTQGLKIKDLHTAEQGDHMDVIRRKSPPGLMRARIKVRDQSVTIDVALNGSHEEDLILGPALLTKLKILGFEHMVNEYITF